MKFSLNNSPHRKFYVEGFDGSENVQLPVMKAVGVVKASADQIFNLVMEYGPERQQ